jgi:hypothetical protein
MKVLSGFSLTSLAIAVITLAGITDRPDTEATTTSPFESASMVTPSASHGGEALVEVARADLEIRSETGLVLLGDRPFSGAALRWHENGSLGERIEYLDGKKHGTYQSWFEDGALAFRGNYAAGRKHGVVETWWNDGVQRSMSHYQFGIAEGTQLEWYASGALFKELNLVDGLESGMQKAWRENGKLFANYEARDGRVFGMKRAKLCFTIEDEKLSLADTIAGD